MLFRMPWMLSLLYLLFGIEELVLDFSYDGFDKNQDRLWYNYAFPVISQMQWFISHNRHSRFIIITMIITIITNCTDLWCYYWFLFKLFETPRDWDQGWNISNEPKKSCVVGQENNMPPIDYSIWGFFVTYPFLKNLSISGNKLPYTGIGFDLPVLALFSFFWRNPSGQSAQRSHDAGDLMQAGEGGPDL